MKKTEMQTLFCIYKDKSHFIAQISSWHYRDFTLSKFTPSLFSVQDYQYIWCVYCMYCFELDWFKIPSCMWANRNMSGKHRINGHDWTYLLYFKQSVSDEINSTLWWPVSLPSSSPRPRYSGYHPGLQMPASYRHLK